MVPVNEPLLTGNEKKYLNECIESGWISSEGPFVKRLEIEFAEIVARQYGVAVCNGSVALDAAVTALSISKGDEIIMPTFTIISCASAIIRNGGIPVLLDADSDTWNMDVSQIEKKITAKTKAIMVVHIYGLPVEMDPILSLARKYNLYVIEDASEMIGQEYKGKKCGSFGDISTFSFYPNKHITTGEGGMVLTDKEELADKCRLIRNLYFKPERRFIHDELGWNFRMTSLQAAVGLAQLERLQFFIEKKRRMGHLYTEQLKDVKGIQLPLPETEYAKNIYWVYGIVLDDNVDFDAEEAMNRLKKYQIGTRPFFWPMHEQPALKKLGLFENSRYPIAERIARRGFYLPSGLSLSEENISYVAQALKEVIS